MSLIEKIQESAVDSGVDLPTLLRKCRLLAARIRSEELAQWVGYELNGYPSKDSLPQYRSISAQSLGDFYSPLGEGMKNVPILSDSLPPEFREYATTQFFLVGARELTELVQTNDSHATIHLDWSHDILLRLGSNIYAGMSCFSAWKLVSRSDVEGILDAVRDRILDFTLEIEAEVSAKSDENSLREISGERSHQVFNTIVLGNVGNLAPGGSGFSQTSDFQVIAGDLPSLKKSLEMLQVPDKDIDELESILQEETAPKDSGTLGDRTAKWIGKMVGEAVSGVWKINVSAAAHLLKQAILSYYDLS